MNLSGDGAACAFKFRVTDDEVNFEAALVIDAMDALQGIDKSVFLSVVEDFRCDEADVPGNRH